MNELTWSGAGTLRFPTVLISLLTALFLAGCGRNDIQVYRISNDSAPSLPAGWEAAPPGQMRVASFRIKGDHGKMAEVSVIPLPLSADQAMVNVNRWRGEVGLAPVSEGELGKLAQPVQVGDETAELYEQAGTNPGSGDQDRVLAAVARHEGQAWFFKMSGDDELVKAQKPAFLQYLKTFDFPSPNQDTAMGGQGELPFGHPPMDGSAAGPFAAAGADAAAAPQQDLPDWQVPSDWKRTEAGPFLVAKFLISAKEGTEAAVNVSSSAGEGGGLLMNVNRWRGQLGLQPGDEADLSKVTSSIDTEGGKATLVDMAGTDARSGQPARMLAVVVPQEGRTWFYKLMGDPGVVQQNKDAFLTFARTVKYH